ncbi:MAG: hypothetical protein H7Y38_05730, partial [Armatimonadetes bacterium]|nr:hypothetical protein [Armatimonadota bacterium]
MLSGDELLKRGQELYNNGIRDAVETEENIGKLVTINVDDNKFIVSDDDLRPRVAFRSAYPGAN